MKQNQVKKYNHGGERPGAGRKRKYGEKTGIIRLPVSLIYELKRLEPSELDWLTTMLQERQSQYDASEWL